MHNSFAFAISELSIVTSIQTKISFEFVHLIPHILGVSQSRFLSCDGDIVKPLDSRNAMKEVLFWGHVSEC